MPNRGMLRDLLTSGDDWARQRRLILLLAVLMFGGGLIVEAALEMMRLLVRALGVME